ncbi:MAG: hypothetical protein V9G04_14300 [Nocardioides sp.]
MRTAATGLWREHGDAQDRERWREVLWSAGSEAYALREAARRTTRLLAKETGVSHAVRSVIDALPPLTATLPEAAAQTLDTALEASQVVTTSLPHGLAWPDFHRLAASRERDYAHSAWAPPDETERVSNPRQTGWWDADAPRRERLSRVNDLGTTGSEARVRACAVLLLDGSDATLDKPLGDQDRVVVRRELERLCAQAWALREVEQRTDDSLDLIAEQIGPDDGGPVRPAEPPAPR